MFWGDCSYYFRDPVSLDVDHGHLIVTHDDKSRSRARLSQGKMYFMDYSLEIDTNDIHDGLHQIASLNSPPNTFLTIRLPQTWGPAEMAWRNGRPE